MKQKTASTHPVQAVFPFLPIVLDGSSEWCIWAGLGFQCIAEDPKLGHGHPALTQNLAAACSSYNPGISHLVFLLAGFHGNF